MLSHSETSHVVHLQINTGYFSDPEELPGLAHLIEHILMLGYPHKQRRISAYTSAENIHITVTHIEHNPQQIVTELLIYICQFEVTHAAIEHETQTIANEFTALKSDGLAAIQEVNKTTCNPAHPYHKFSTGNHASFRRQSTSALVEFAQQWLQQHVSPSNINVYIILAAAYPADKIDLTRLTLPQMQTASLFQPTKIAKSQPVPTFEHCYPELYLPRQQQIELLISASTRQPRVILSFALHISATTQPHLDTLIVLLNYPNWDALPHQLQQHGLIQHYQIDTGLQVGSTIELNINMAVTALGLRQYARIVHLWLMCLHAHADLTLSASQTKHIELLRFWRNNLSELAPIQWHEWCEHYHPSSVACTANMQSGNELHDIIRQCQSTQLRVLLIAQDEYLPYNADDIQLTPWYGTKFQIRPILPYHNDTDPLARYAIRPFIHDLQWLSDLPTPAAIKAYRQTCLSSPVHSHSPNHQLWYQPSDPTQPSRQDVAHCYLAFEQPANVAIHKRVDAPLSIVAKRIWVTHLHNQCAALRYQLTMLGGSCKIYPQQNGFTVKLACPAPLLMDILTDLIAQIITPQSSLPEYAELHHYQLQRITQQQPISAYQAAYAQLSTHLNHYPDLLEPDTFNAISQLSEAATVKYQTRFFEAFVCEGLVCGSLPAVQVEQLNQLLLNLTARSTHLNEQDDIPTLPWQQHPSPIFTSRLLVSEHTFAVPCWVCLLLTPHKTLLDTIYAMTLAEVLAEPFFQRFRQELQLGYDVGSGFITHQQHPGISFYINYTQQNALAIHAMLLDFFAEMSAALPQLSSSWSSIQANLTHQLSVDQQGAAQQAQHLWMQLGQLGGIDHDNALITLINRCSFAEFLAYSQSLLDPTSNPMLGSICTVGNDPSIGPLLDRFADASSLDKTY